MDAGAVPMNIVLVGHQFGGVGGTEGQASMLAPWLVRRGHEVTLVARRVDPAAAAGARVVSVDVPGGLVGALAWPLAARRAIPAGADVVQAFVRGVGHDVYRAGGGAHAAFVRASRGWRPTDAAHLALDHLAIRSAKLVICNSEMGADDVRRSVPGAAVRVVRNAVDCGRFPGWDQDRRPLKLARGVPGRLVVFVGSGFARKGLAMAAEAFGRLAAPGDRLAVVGKDRRGLPAAALALGERLIAAGECAPDPWLAAADAMILPTLYDPCANAVLEAMAAGVPPITTTADGAAELVPDRRLIIGPGAGVGALIQALGYAWAGGPALRRRVREAAERWTIDRCGLATEEIYGEIAQE
jgi:UDP-glucose:(heptosyl)LPS alpha-1,3-glucosyltransferase